MIKRLDTECGQECNRNCLDFCKNSRDQNKVFDRIVNDPAYYGISLERLRYMAELAVSVKLEDNPVPSIDKNHIKALDEIFSLSTCTEQVKIDLAREVIEFLENGVEANNEQPKDFAIVHCNHVSGKCQCHTFDEINSCECQC